MILKIDQLRLCVLTVIGFKLLWAGVTPLWAADKGIDVGLVVATPEKVTLNGTAPPVSSSNPITSRVRAALGSVNSGKKGSP